MVDLTYDSKWYAIIQVDDHIDDDEEVPLAYITPFGTDAAFEKRKETGLSWAGGYSYRYEKEKPEIQQFQFDNEKPVSGYRITKSVTRYMTSNKAFRVTHPQGFQFEIYADNLAEILLNDGIVGGVLLGSYILTKQNNNIYLVKEGDPRIVERAKMKSVSKVSPGDIISYQKNRYMAVGELDMNWLNHIGDITYHNYGHPRNNISANADNVSPDIVAFVQNIPRTFSDSMFDHIYYTFYKFERGMKNMFIFNERLCELTPKKFNLVSSGNPVPDNLSDLAVTAPYTERALRQFSDVDITTLTDEQLLEDIGRGYRVESIVYHKDGILVVRSQ